MDSTVTNAELVDRPAISHEDYLDLVAKRQVVLEKKSRKSDLQDYRDSLVKQMEELDATLEGKRLQQIIQHFRIVLQR
jgi:hypothetical protein